MDQANNQVWFDEVLQQDCAGVYSGLYVIDLCNNLELAGAAWGLSELAGAAWGLAETEQSITGHVHADVIGSVWIFCTPTVLV